MVNIGKIAIDNVSLELEKPKDNLDFFKEREQRLVNIIESLHEVQNTKAWSSLTQEVFKHLPKSLESQISQEAKKLNPDIQKLNRLSGELKWAERFSDFKKLEDTFRVELQSIRQKLYGTS